MNVGINALAVCEVLLHHLQQEKKDFHFTAVYQTDMEQVSCCDILLIFGAFCSFWFALEP